MEIFVDTILIVAKSDPLLQCDEGGAGNCIVGLLPVKLPFVGPLNVAVTGAELVTTLQVNACPAGAIPVNAIGVPGV